MGAASLRRTFPALLLFVIVGDGGVLVQKCQQPLRCVSLAECSTEDQRNSGIIFTCMESERNGMKLCCHTVPQSLTIYDNSSAHQEWESADQTSKSSDEILLSNWNPEGPIHISPGSPYMLDKPVTDPNEGFTKRRNEVPYHHNELPDVTPVSHESLVKLNKSSEVLAENSSKLTQISGSHETNGHESTKPSSTGLSSVALTGSSRHVMNQKMNLLPIDDCGLSTALRITNGQNASFGQFPWMALLGYRLRDGSLSFLCGGTLINRQYILTAAHCLDPEDAVLEEVRLGEHNLDTEQDCDTIENYCADPVLDVPIEAAVRHENFNSPYLKNDIALLRLQSPINSNTDYIRPICLPFGLNITGLEEKKYQVAGWGKTDYYDSEGSAVLQFTGILSMPLRECDSRQEKEVRPLDQTQFCAGADMGKDACKGDSGGPLMETMQAPSQSHTQTFQIGIVSFGSVPCGAKYSPSVYTRVTAYLDWILDNIEP